MVIFFFRSSSTEKLNAMFMFMFRLEISWILFLEAPSFSHFSYFKPCMIQKQEQHVQKLASTIPVSWRKRKNVHHHLADCPAVFFRFACLHSWRWEPSLLCGTFKAVLQHQKLGSQTVFFCKFGILHDEGRRESKKMMKNRQKVPVFSLLVLGPDLLRDILGSAWNVVQNLWRGSKCWAWNLVGPKYWVRDFSQHFRPNHSKWTWRLKNGLFS